MYMLTVLIIFAAILLSGLAFWFFNRRQINTLTEQIDDKTLVINALKNHVEESPTTKTLDLNDGWRGSAERSTNLTPSVEEALSQPQKKRKNNSYKKKSNSNQNTQNPNKQNKTGQNQNPRPKKNKTPKNS